MHMRFAPLSRPASAACRAAAAGLCTDAHPLPCHWLGCRDAEARIFLYENFLTDEECEREWNGLHSCGMILIGRLLHARCICPKFVRASIRFFF